jgi:Cu(I)/Ag(I) efflux system protein CusF
MSMKAFLPLIALASLVACSPPASQPAVKSNDVSSMQMETSSATTTQAGPIRSTGTVTQVDAAAGTITFDHQAIPAVNWPAMTMQFHADNPAILQGIAVGDHVSFELKSASEPSIVTRVEKQ